jgi:hypothetical protein
MLRASTWVFLLCVSISSLSACTTTKVQTFSAPSLAATQIESIAILPFQHTRFGPHIALSLNRSIEQAFAARNQRMRIVGPAEARAILGPRTSWKCTRNLCVITVLSGLQQGRPTPGP